MRGRTDPTLFDTLETDAVQTVEDIAAESAEMIFAIRPTSKPSRAVIKGLAQDRSNGAAPNAS